MSASETSRLHERRAERRRAVRRRRLIVLAVLAAAAAGAAIAVLRLTGGEGSASGAPAAPAAPAPPPAPPAAPPAVEPIPVAAEQERPAARQDASVTIAAVGDIVMGSGSDLPPDAGRSFFDDVDQALRGAIVLGNLEGTLSKGGSSKCGSGGSPNCFAFQMPPAYARWLEKAGFTVLNLANNHAYDYGASGLKQTLAALDRQGLKHTGRPGEIAFQDVGPVRVAILGFASYPWSQNLLDIAGAKRFVREADARADLVVVTFHGGAEGSDKTHVPHGTEYYLGENRGSLRAFAHAVVGAGADLVVGHGPHVLRGMEWYRGRLIAYSLGNFAGYGVFTLSGVLAVSGILRVTLHADGSWVKGKLVATQLAGRGVPALDPAERAHGLVRTLSREDFGRRGVRVSSTGALLRPA